MSTGKKKTFVLVALLVLMWGLSWSILKIGLHYAPPLLFAGIRTLVGGLALAIIALPQYREIHFRKNWHVYVISSLFNVVLFFGLQTIGLWYLPSGLLSVLVYLEPILVGFLAWLWLKETFTAVKVVGLVLGFLGVLSVSSEGLNGHTSVFGMLVALGAAVAWAIGTVYFKKVQGRVNMLWLIAMQFVIGGVVLSAGGFMSESWSAIHWTLPFWLSTIYSCFVGVSLSWVIWIMLVHAGEVSRVSAFTFFVPLLSVFIGTFLLHEPFTAMLFVGLVLIVAGIYLVNRPTKVPTAVPVQGVHHEL